MKKFLVATDLSARSDRALQRALMLGHEQQAEVEVLHVVDDDWPRLIVDQHEKSARPTLFDQIAAVPMSREVLREEIEKFKPDMVAIGTHSRSGIAHAMLGSVAVDLLADAPVDVLAVKAW